MKQDQEAALASYLSTMAETPFSMGRCDCMLMMADWVGARRGVDVAADLRGTYDDDAGAEAVVAAAGGPVALLASRFEPMLVRTDDPMPGDVGLIATPLGPAGAIKVRNGWAWKAERGIVVMPHGFIVAWRV